MIRHELKMASCPVYYLKKNQVLCDAYNTIIYLTFLSFFRKKNCKKNKPSFSEQLSLLIWP